MKEHRIMSIFEYVAIIVFMVFSNPYGICKLKCDLWNKCLYFGVLLLLFIYLVSLFKDNVRIEFIRKFDNGQIVIVNKTKYFIKMFLIVIVIIIYFTAIKEYSYSSIEFYKCISTISGFIFIVYITNISHYEIAYGDNFVIFSNKIFNINKVLSYECNLNKKIIIKFIDGSEQYVNLTLQSQNTNKILTDILDKKLKISNLETSKTIL